MFFALKELLIGLIRRLTGAHIYRVPPRGLVLNHDLNIWLPRFQVRVIFDVGANIGQSATMFRAWFPGARLYAFEPVATNFGQLQRTLQGDSDIQCFKLAFSSAPRRGRMVLQGSSELFFLQGSPEKWTTQDVQSAACEDVDVETIDAFCRARHIEGIDFLKIDTEGADLDVLQGTVELLTRQAIAVVQVEAGMNPYNERHVPFEALKRFLESYDYLLFGLYEQVNEWPTRAPHLRRTNAVFVSRRLSDSNSG